jgi:DNA-binding PadR family transcriptional regulator
MSNPKRQIEAKLIKGLLDLVILQFLKSQPMHGYQIITSIRKNFGVYFGPSTIYPLLGTLEEKGYIKSQWDLTNERPRKVYSLTSEGQNLLSFTEDSLNLLCRKIETIGVNRLVINNGLNKKVCQAIKPTGIMNH